MGRICNLVAVSCAVGKSLVSHAKSLGPAPSDQNSWDVKSWVLLLAPTFGFQNLLGSIKIPKAGLQKLEVGPNFLFFLTNDGVRVWQFVVSSNNNTNDITRFISVFCWCYFGV